MLKNLKALYPNIKFSKGKPDDNAGRFHWFSNTPSEWIGIPVEELLDNQLILLKTLFSDYYPENNHQQTTVLGQTWYSFLFENGPIPKIEEETAYRFTYFKWSNVKISPFDIEPAIRAFFDSDIVIVWETEFEGLIVEQKNSHPLGELDYIAMIETLKSDFYMEPHFYIGKFRVVTPHSLPLFHHEKQLFKLAQKTFKSEKLYHFEKIAPDLLIQEIQDPLLSVIKQDIIPVFLDDHELFLTIKVFLENNMNSSITAKKLFIHRNTLQYRLDKFTDKTGIPLKDFHSAMTVYFACILYRTI